MVIFNQFIYCKLVLNQLLYIFYNKDIIEILLILKISKI